jgi:hypothetical protein
MTLGFVIGCAEARAEFSQVRPTLPHLRRDWARPAHICAGTWARVRQFCAKEFTIENCLFVHAVHALECNGPDDSVANNPLGVRVPLARP